jgi:hypothetical protein
MMMGPRLFAAGHGFRRNDQTSVDTLLISAALASRRGASSMIIG